ncbi:hypothetical protein ACFV2H_29930 [Streptomyces sp. NPDC059629]|uniref:SLAC1 family transporter n=1 Tax=Streptomyces sp. NPDC059629 TaxID=3346889 RepID=UPI003680650D
MSCTRFTSDAGGRGCDQGSCGRPLRPSLRPSAPSHPPPPHHARTPRAHAPVPRPRAFRAHARVPHPRPGQARPRLRYDVRRWATVFPMGLTAAATLSVEAAVGILWPKWPGRLLVWIAVLAWLGVAAGAVATARSALRKTP